MKTKTKYTGRFSLGIPVYGKRDYYFHADEDFREDRDWGKARTANLSKSKLDTQVTLNP